MKNKFFKHIGLVIKHRHLVFVACTKCGLFWRGLMHDLSKFSPVELFESAKYYTGTHSPIAECRKDKGYSLAWIHHISKNKHHYEYWYDAQNEVQMNIPYKYAVECVCDMLSASKCYYKKDYKPKAMLEYWLRHKPKTTLNDGMKDFYDTVFTDLVEHGEKYILNKKYMKKTYNEKVLKR